MKNKILILPIIFAIVLLSILSVSAVPTLVIVSPANNTIYADSLTKYINITSSLNITTGSNGTILYSLDNGTTNSTYTTPVARTFANSTYRLDTWAVNLTTGAVLNTTYSAFSFEVPSAFESNSIYLVMKGSGAGLGIFIQYMSQALPVLLIILAMIGIIVMIGMGVAYVVKNSFAGHRR